MATTSLRFTFSNFIQNQYLTKHLLFSNKTNSIRILCFSSAAASPPSSSLETLPPPPPAVNYSISSSERWQPYRKKKVVMRVGYVGTDYRGLQMQKDDSISRRRRRKMDTTQALVAERRQKRVRRNWWWLCRGEASKPSSLGEFLEFERRFGVDALFSDAMMDVNLYDHHRNGSRVLFANGRVLPPPLVSDVNEGSHRHCSFCGVPVLLAGICGGVR